MKVYVSLCICECLLTYVIMCGRDSMLFGWTLSGYVFLCSLIIFFSARKMEKDLLLDKSRNYTLKDH